MTDISEIASASSTRNARGVTFVLVAAGLMSIAAVLRLLAADGDLWFDEIWSLSLVADAASPADILFGISHDNNHYLNSLWLWLIGPDAPPLIHRGLSITMGAGSVLVAALVFRTDRIAACIAMLLVAVAAPLINHGAEARGYAGLALFAFLAYAATARLIEDPESKRARAGLGVAATLGFLSHLAFLFAFGAAAAWMVFDVWRRTGSFRTAERAVFAAFTWALCGALFVGLCVAIGALNDGFEIGGVAPFTLGGLVEGYGGLLRGMIGLPDAVPTWLLLTLLAGLLAFTITRPGLIDRRFVTLYVVALVILPAAMALLQIKNTSFGRYFLASGVVAVIFIADVCAHAIRSGVIGRITVAMALVFVVAGNLLDLGRFDVGDTRYSQAVALMGSEGTFSYGADAGFRTEATVTHHARRQGVEATHIAFEAWCVTPPGWVVLEKPIQIDANGTGKVTPPGCSLPVAVSQTPRDDFVGIGWTIYRTLPAN